ncbi:YDG domain-containing protein, partial [Limnohabitans radicicola]
MRLQTRTLCQMLQALGLVASVCVSASALAGQPPNALPTGGQVAAGQAAISQSGNAMTVNQTSQRAVVNWDSYNVGSNATVNYNQPSSQAVILNRVTGSGASQIDGAIKANGTVIIANANGVSFGKGAEVNAGAVVATTMNQSDAEFMSGSNTWSGNGTGKVVNKGKIQVTDTSGYVALLAPEVRNQGVILATVSASNAVVAGAGEKVTLQFSGSKLMGVTVDKAAVNALIENKRAIEVAGGVIALAAGSVNQLMRSVINNTGRLVASSMTDNGGKVELVAATVNNNGTIAANANGEVGHGGSIQVVANNVNLGTQSNIQANAKTHGNGGNVHIWANEQATLAGQISATGGALSGNGGVIDTSAKLSVKFDPSLKVDTSAKNGRYGQWTVDPLELTVDAASASLISSALRTTNVTLDATGSACVGSLANCSSSQTPLIHFVAGANIYSNNASTVLRVLAPGGTINLNSNIEVGQVYMEAATVNVNAGGNIGTTGGAGSNIFLVGAQINILGGLGSNGQTSSGSSSAASIGSNRRRRGLDSGLSADDATYTTNGGNIVVLATGDISIGSSATLTANGQNGGTITIVSQAGTVTHSGVVDAVGTRGQGGQITLAGQVGTFLVGALTSVDGATAGGKLQIGIAQNMGSGTTLAPPAIGPPTAYLNSITFSTITSGVTALDSQTGLTANASSAIGAPLHTAGQILVQGQTTLTSAATLQANADHGGSVAMASAGDYRNTGYIQTNGGAGLGGTIQIEADHILLGAGSQINATGTLGGGSILIGGDWQGSGTVRHATTVTMSQGASIDASATQNGNGGKVVLWSDIHKADSVTAVHGAIYAKGGVYGGHGGQVETSGHLLQVDGIAVNTAAPLGASGQWLLDPYDIVINTAGAQYTNSSGTITSNNACTTVGPNCSSYIDHTVIESALNNGNVTVQSSAGYNIVIQGDGTVTTNSSNTLTYQSGGNITFNYDSATYPGGVNGANLNLVLQATGTITANAPISVNSVTASAVGFAGSGSLSLGTGGISINQSGNSTFSGEISGANAVFTKDGAGTLTLSGASTFMGGIIVNAGTLKLGANPHATVSNDTVGGGNLFGSTTDSPLGLGAITINAGATLDTNGFDISAKYSVNNPTVYMVGASAASQAKLINSSTTASTVYSGISLTNAATVNDMSNVIAQVGGSGTLTILGSVVDGAGTNYAGLQIGDVGYAGKVILQSNNAFHGNVSVNFGTLQIGYGTSLGSGDVSVNSGAVLDLNGQSVSGTGTLTLNGTGIGGGGALINTSASPATYPGLIALAGNASVVGDTGTIALTATGTVTGSGFGLTLGGAQGGSLASIIGTDTGTLTKTGSGTWLLSGANTYSGATAIQAGTLQAGSATALGSGTVTVASGAVLDLNGQTLTSTGALTLNGTGIASGGALINSSATPATYAGLITLGSASSVVGDTGAIALTATGTLTGSGLGLTLGGAQGGSLASIIGTDTGTLTKSGAGTWLLSGLNTYSGATSIQAGTLQAGSATAVGSGTVTVASGAVLDLYGQTMTSTGLLILNGSGIAASGALMNSSTNAATYAGLARLASATTIKGDAGTVALSNTGTITGATFGLTLGGAQGGSVASIIGTTSGTVTKQDAGTWTLNGVSTYTGITTISGGVLSVSVMAIGGTASGIGQSTNAAANLVINGGTLQYTGGTASTDRLFTLGSNGGGLDASGTGELTWAATGSVVLTASTSPTLTLTGTGLGTFKPVVPNAATSGTTALSKTGTGTWTFSAINSTYTGATNISNGVLKMGTNSVFSSGTAVTVNSNGTLDLNGQNLSKSLTLNGGTLTNSNTSSIGYFKGSVVGGTVVTLTADSKLTAANGAKLYISDYSSTSGAISGAFAITIGDAINRGDVIYANNFNTYSGLTTVDYGVLRILNSATSSIPGPLTVNANGTLDIFDYTFSKNITLNGGVLTGTSTVATQNPRYTGIITLTANSTIAGFSRNAGINIETGGIVSTGNYGVTIGTSTYNGRVNFFGVTSPNAYSYTGDTIVAYGILSLSTDSPVSNSSLLRVDANGTLRLTGTSFSKALTLNGGTLISSLTATINSAITLTANSNIAVSNGQTATLSATGSISGNFNLTYGVTPSNIYTGIYTSSGQINAGSFGVNNYYVINSLGTTDFTLIGASSNTVGTLFKATGFGTGTGNALSANSPSNYDGTVLVNSNNSYPGITNIAYGTLKLGVAGTAPNSPLGTVTGGTVVAAGATLDVNGLTLATAEPLTLNGNGMAGQGALKSISNTPTYAGLVNLGSNSLIYTQGTNLILSNTGQITGDGFTLSFNGGGEIKSIIATGAGGFTKAGTGTTLTLSGLNTYTGVTSIVGGTLAATTLADGGLASSIGMSSYAASNLILGSGTTGGGLTYTGNTNVSTNRLFTVSANSTTAATLTTSGTGNLTFTNSGSLVNNASGANTLVLSPGSNTTLTLNPVWSDPASGVASLTASGSGIALLSGLNTYSGVTTISSGTLSVSNLANGGLASNIGQSSNAASNLVLGAGAKLIYTGGTASTDRLFTIQGNATLDASGTGALTFSNAGALTNAASTSSNTLTLQGSGTATLTPVLADYSAASSKILALTKSGTGTWILPGLNTYTGVTKANGGVLSVATLANGGVASGIGQSTNASTNLSFDGGTLQYTGSVDVSTDRLLTIASVNGGAIDVSGTGKLTWVGSSTGSFPFQVVYSASFATTLTLTGTGVGDFQLKLLNPTSSTASLIKNGTGTWRLSAAGSAYTGTATVNAGVFQLFNGYGLGSASTVTVNPGGTLDVFNSSVSKLITLNGGAAISSTGTAGALTGGITLTADSILAAASNATFTVSTTQITGTSGLTIGNGSNLGTVVLSGFGVTKSTTSYSGATTVSSGATLDLKINLACTTVAGCGLNSSYTGAGNIILEPATANSSMFIGGTTGSMYYPVDLFNGASRKFADGFSSIVLRTTGTANTVVSAAATFTDSVTLVSDGNIQINPSYFVATTQADGVLVVAAQNYFINTTSAGSTTALRATGGGSSRWIVYTKLPISNTTYLGGLNSNNQAYWGSTYSTLAPSAVGAGNRYVFSDGITITTTNASKTYGTTVDISPNYTVTGAYTTPASTFGDVYLPVSVTDILATLPTITAASSADSDTNAAVGTYAMSASGAVAKTGYGFTYASTGNGVMTVNPAAVTLGVVGSKTYDGTAVFNAGSVVVSGLANGDTLGTATANSAKVADNGSNYFVSFTLSSGTASNYVLVNGYNAATNSATINPLALTPVISAASSTYGASVSPGMVTFSNKVSADVVTASAVSIVSPQYSAANKLKAGSYAQSITDALTGADAGNYTLTGGYTTPTSNYTVTPLALTASIASASSTYGAVVVPGAASFSNVVGADVVTPGAVSIVSPLYSSGNKLKVGAYAQSISATLGGADAGNYTLTGGYTSAANYTVNTLALTGSIATGSTTYGDALVPGAVTWTNKVSGDVITPTVSVNTAGNTSTSGKLKAGSYTGIQSVTGLAGTDAANYSYAGVTGDYTVSQLALTASIASASSTYGAAVVPGAASFSNVVGADVVTPSAVSMVSPAYSTSNKLKAGTYAQSITATLGGADAVNYVLSNGFTSLTNNYTVNPLALTGSIATGSTTYGATLVPGAVTLANVVGNDVVTPTASVTVAAGNTSTAGKLKAGSYTGIQGISALAGADAANYSYGGVTGDYTVSPLALVASITSASSTYGSAVTVGTASFSNVVGADTVTPSAVSIVSPAYSTSNNLKAGTYAQRITSTLGGADAGNYTLTGGYTTGTNNYTVNTLSLTGSIAAGSTTYGASLVPGAVTLTNVVGSDVVTPTVSVTVAVGNTSTAGKLKAGSYTGIQGITALGGADAANYTYASVTGDYTVSPLALVASITSGSSVYGSALVLGTPSFSNVVGADVVTPGAVSIVSPAYSASNHLVVGAYKQSISASLGGADAGNYVLTGGFTSATPNYLVSPLGLTIASQTAVNKVYTGTTAAAINSASASLVGVVVGDDVTLDSSGTYGTFASANVANGIAVAVAGNALAGASAANYTLSQPTGLSANITPAPLTVTANADSKIIGQSDAAGYGGVSYSGFVAGQSAANLGGTLVITRTNGSTNSAGVYTGVLQPSGLTSSNYTISYVNGDYTVVPADTLMVRSANTSSIYGTAATFAAPTVQYLNSAQNVILTLSQTSASGNTYSFSDGVGGSASFTLGATGTLSTSGNLVAGNYSITGLNFSQVGNNFNNPPVYAGTLTVAPKAVTASTNSVSKVYDGTAAMQGLAISLANVVTGDQVTAGGAGAFAQANVGTNLNYSVSNLALSGGDSGNYYLTGGTTFSGSNGNITPATLTYVATVATSTYGSTPQVNAGSVTGFVPGDNLVNATTGTLLFSTTATGSSNVGTHAVTGSGLTANNGNYTFVQAPANTTALTINPAPLTVSGTKVYDGNGNFSHTQMSVAGAQNGEAVTLTAGSATASGSGAGAYAGTGLSGLTISVSGGNALAGNYTLPSSGDMAITARPITLTANTQTTAYGTALGLGTTAYTLSSGSLVSGDAISGVTLQYNGNATVPASTNAGTYTNGIVASAATGTGGFNASNYNISYIPGNLTVSRVALSITARAQSTTYGTALALGTTAYDLSGSLVNGETLSAVTLQYNGSATVPANTNAATYTNAIVASGATGTGGFSAANYTITYAPANLTVNPKAVTITNNAGSTTYNGTSTYASLVAAAGYTATALAGSDAIASVAQGFTVGGNAVSGVAQAGSFVATPSAVVLASGTASNYSFSYVGATHTVAKANLSVTATASLSGNVYNGSAYTGTYTTSLLGSDTLTVTGVATGVNAGTYTSNLQVSGAALANYNTPVITNADLIIDPKPISVSGQTAVNKVYTGTTAAAINSASASLVGAVVGDDVSLNATGAYGTFASANVANGIAVTVAGNALSGTKASNYTLSQPTGLSANITPAPLTVTANADSKIIGQSDAAGYGGVSYSGFVAGQSAANLGG